MSLLTNPKMILLRWQHQLAISPVSELLIKGVYATLIWSTIKLLWIGDVVWGANFLTILYDPYTGPDRFAMLLNNPDFRPYYAWFVIPFLALLFLGLSGRHNVFTRAAVWYLFVVLHYGNVEISSGGHHLYQQLLFFHVVLFRVGDADLRRLASAKRLLHHLGFYAIWVQIALLYLVSGVWKLKGDTWLSGDALLLTLSFKEFGFPWLSSMLTQNTWWLIVGNYIALGYQLLFPIAIWIKLIRPYWLLLGLVFHLSIAFLVGITDFGLFMAASYLVFLSPTVAQQWLTFIDLKKRNSST